uniref:Sulfatase domain-containing protein n=1 Tax=Strongyloides papillosus TaxID=174720 RepID=A0A0N5C3E0_STREA
MNIFAIIFIIIVDIYFLKNVIGQDNDTFKKQSNFEKFVGYLKEETEYKKCQIKNYPFKLSVGEFFSHPYKQPKCKRNWSNKYFHSSNGILKYKDNFIDIYCKYRCNFPKGDSNVKLGKWKNIKNARPECDVYEVICKSKTSGRIVFYDIFLQLYKLNDLPSEKVHFLQQSYPVEKIKHKYNVHVIVVDSLSHFNAMRGFPKTLEYLKSHYKGVMFKYLNKVGYGSQANGHAFLLNRRVIDLYDFETDQFSISDYGEPIKAYKKYLDSEPYIGKYFRQLNYTVLMNEDSFESVFSMYNSKGFFGNIAHHTTRPFFRKIKKLYSIKKYREGRLIKSKCLENPDYQLEYLKLFMESYKNRRQFTLTWIAQIAHNHLTGHFQFDTLFKNFFESNKEILDNGFVIFMGDHGFKMGPYRVTELGAYEDNNPFLVIAPPKELRCKKSEVLENLIYNSNKHISQFDVYTTMLDIATEGSRSNFKDMKQFNFSEIIKDNQVKGLSLLRKIENYRTCFEMEVSSQYCLCSMIYRNFNKEVFEKVKMKNGNHLAELNYANDIIKIIRKNFINYLNYVLRKARIKNICTNFRESKKGFIDIKYSVSKNRTLIFLVKQEVKPKGIYETYFNEKGDLYGVPILRVDRYHSYVKKCSPPKHVEMYCYCKNTVI